jgi:hypothetical protein
MSLNHTGQSSGTNSARGRAAISAAQRQSAHASTLRDTGAAEALPLHDRITARPDQGRIRVGIMRRSERVFYLSHDEVAYLFGLLSPYVFPVTVSRVEDRGARP